MKTDAEKKGWRAFLVLTVVCVAALVSGCDIGESGHDAGVAGRDDTSRHVYNMIDGTPNVTAFCSFGNLVYIGSRSGSGSGFATVVEDAHQCKGVADGGQPHA